MSRPAMAELGRPSAAGFADNVIDLTQPAPGPERPIRVLLVHEVRLFAEVLRVALAEQAGLEVLPSVAVLGDAVRAARQTRPNVIVMDLEGRTADGVAVLRELRVTLPESSVLVVTGSASPVALTDAVQAGAHGYLTMDAEMADVVNAIRATAEGRQVLSERRLQALARHLEQQSASTESCAALLTERERDVLVRLVQGQSTRMIAGELNITLNTARTHIQNVLSKLGVHSRLEAAARAVRERLV